MNVYDFDKTIYSRDCSVDFYKFNLKKNPALAKYWPGQVQAALQYKQRKISKTEMKTKLYKYFEAIDDMNKAVQDFWAEHLDHMQVWYLTQKREDDVIVTASPEFLVAPVGKKIGFKVIGSIVDPKTGRNLRPNCHGDEKVVRFQEHFDIEEIEEFYSDSYSDDPLAQYAKKAFMVNNDELKDW